MGDYGRDLDEYEDYEGYEDYEDEEGGEEEEEEEVEEEERKPTEEELQYLELRARLKEQIRKKMQKENGSAASKSSSLDRKSKFSSDSYGSFFGPSQPFISNRVIQESKSLLENQHLALKMLQSQHTKKNSSSTSNPSKNGVQKKPTKVNELKVKAQKLKDTRDYSFLLSDDAELPAPTKEPTARSISAPKSEARSALLQQKSKQPSGSSSRNFPQTSGSSSRNLPQKSGSSSRNLPQTSGSSSRNVPSARDERKPVSLNGHLHSKPGPDKSTSVSRPNPASLSSKRQLGSNNGMGPGRPAKDSTLTAASTMVKKAPIPGPRNILPAGHKPPPPRIQSSVSMHQQEQRSGVHELSKAKPMPRQLSASSKPQTNKPVKHMSSHASFQDSRPKKKPARRVSDDEDEKALSMIRRMFNTQRYQDRPDDDSDMEANFEDIMREERLSEKIARKEDEEQLRLIEEEERRERMRKLKKRKLGQR
ncbi:hypothetical protein Tsubulata_047880 [Turnera subulata]|uniref:Protein SPT2 homolog n=1 Tax=Turnera subulata TaxID=218843 RepID=A0A9Q0JHQ4_9ROSI|nr:hypothetical protein Tsubulata_047880 [Turnera subulata]